MYCYYLYSAGHVSVQALSALIDWLIEYRTYFHISSNFQTLSGIFLPTVSGDDDN